MTDTKVGFGLLFIGNGRIRKFWRQKKLKIFSNGDCSRAAVTYLIDQTTGSLDERSIERPKGISMEIRRNENSTKLVVDPMGFDEGSIERSKGISMQNIEIGMISMKQN